jgi:hypothetical protein
VVVTVFFGKFDNGVRDVLTYSRDTLEISQASLLGLDFSCVEFLVDTCIDSLQQSRIPTLMLLITPAGGPIDR